jgi:UDP-glucose:(heptosyl)LPS alpha-1,3-glucosyltransferase
VIRNAVDTKQFNSAARLLRRGAARAAFSIGADEFVFLIIGNDWKKKGVDMLLRALALCKEIPVRLLVVGQDSPEAYANLCDALGVSSRVSFLSPSADVLQFYAAADSYVGPSLEDAYGLPVLEAMACGLPVIASAAAGVSEIVTDGENGLILRDPRDAEALAALLRQIAMSPEFAYSLARAAERTAAGESWDAYTDRMIAHFEEVIAKKKSRQTRPESVSV